MRMAGHIGRPVGQRLITAFLLASDAEFVIVKDLDVPGHMFATLQVLNGCMHAVIGICEQHGHCGDYHNPYHRVLLCKIHVVTAVVSGHCKSDHLHLYHVAVITLLPDGNFPRANSTWQKIMRLRLQVTQHLHTTKFQYRLARVISHPIFICQLSKALFQHSHIFPWFLGT